MAIGIDPKVDFVFKLVFGNPEHTKITIHFLNAVLNLAHPIVWVEILNPIQGKDRSEDKMIVLDVLARDSQGRTFNIEMQTTIVIGLRQRLTYYSCLNYVRQLGKGEEYHELRPAISICVLDRTLFPQSEAHHLSFRLRCDQEDLVLTDDLQIHAIELPKFWPSAGEILQCSDKKKWLYFLVNAEYLDAEDFKVLLPGPEYEEASGVLAMISQTPEERQFYEDRLKFLRDQNAQILQARFEGRQEGIDEGIEKGIEKGREEGIEKGMLAGKIQILQQLLGESETSVLVLGSHPVAELSSMLRDLQNRLRTRDV
ncbi:MAG TPA: Rpn family recombination-promoting nuclease/putative transposase [Planctomycetaceae bacterium]|nr:Rpn family recombination-promoting nuclease/putative transposase [Planctomycetaceae bacterium]HQZ63765.1 Rpn family recombination-promoting nuclease/putative transposase [Planctomycetaceae bacterium]